MLRRQVDGVVIIVVSCKYCMFGLGARSYVVNCLSLAVPVKSNKGLGGGVILLI